MTTGGVVAIVLTLNEAEHLPDCLASLRLLTDRVIVLDSGSTDGTQAVALAAGAEWHTRPFDGYASQRNAALELACDAEWVLFLDADERLTEAGASEIHAALASAGTEIAAFWLPRRNIFFGRELRGGGWWPDAQARLLRPGRAHYDPTRQVHEVLVVDGGSRRLRVPMIHLNYASRREFVAKQRDYTRQRVDGSDDDDVPRLRALAGAPVREFWRRFVRLKGYRDGLTGLFLAGVLAIEEARAVVLLRARVRQS
ncbi:MAG TPA: glycosyltransferase family 2 protein [Thermomicrobiales bacterium]|nr:glycosyltransferase family 2 protein [Thermomicrobiales bacterium]